MRVADPFPAELNADERRRPTIARASRASHGPSCSPRRSRARRLPSAPREGEDEKTEKTEKWTEPQVEPAQAESYAIPQGDVTEIWDDPVFKRQFVAGYGINADVEPRVSPDEVEVLEKIRPLMAQTTSPRPRRR